MSTVYIIERTDCLATYYDAQMGRNFGAPQGGWNPDIDAATPFKTRDDAQARIDTLGHMAPFCEPRAYMPGTNQKPGVPDAARPRYRLTEAAYINDTYYVSGAEITYFDIPGRHMEPINAAAQAKFDEHYPLGAATSENIAELLALAPLASLKD